MGNCYKTTLKKINKLAKEIKELSTKVDELIPDDINDSSIKKEKIINSSLVTTPNVIKTNLKDINVNKN